MLHSVIARGRTLEDLNNDISKNIEQGFVPHGNIQVSSQGAVIEYYQLMIFRLDIIDNYDVIVGKSIEELEEKVNKAVSFGDNEPCGSLVVVDHKITPEDSDAPIHEIETMYYQPIVHRVRPPIQFGIHD